MKYECKMKVHKDVCLLFLLRPLLKHDDRSACVLIKSNKRFLNEYLHMDALTFTPSYSCISLLHTYGMYDRIKYIFSMY